jgi:zinc D-Ala-D-Ala carboxypeptidase
MKQEFLTKLQELRDVYNAPMILSSAYRCGNHNNTVSSSGYNGPHTTGRAVDILVSGKNAHKLVGLAFSLGFTGIGLSQKGEHRKRFIHLDDLWEGKGPRPWIWTY